MINHHRIVFHISTTSARGKLEKISYESFSDRNMEKFVMAVRNRIGMRANPNSSLPLVSNTQKDIVSELQELGRLKEEGLLTEDEFEQAKRKLLY